MKFVQQPMQQEISDSPAIPDSLAIEVIGRGGSIAMFCGDRLVAARLIGTSAPASPVRGERTPAGGGESRAAADLIPAIANLARDVAGDESLRFLQSISVAVGPGSFTGLRIAVTTAKTLAYALQIPILAVNSLAAIAETGPATRPILVGLAAYRGQVYRGRFLPPAGRSDRRTEESGPRADIELVTAEEWTRDVQVAVGKFDSDPEHRFAFLGDRNVYEKAGVSIPAEDWVDVPIRAVGVGQVAVRMWRAGQTTAAMDLLPDYLRPSSAEEAAGR